MAVSALEIDAVIQWFVKQARVHIDVRNPRGRRVAFIAFMNGIEVLGIHARCRVAVMAGRTGAEHFAVIDSGRRGPGRRRMAIFASDTGIDVIEILARGVGAVVAFEAVPGDIYMVEISRYPSHCCMAVIAVITAGDMGRVFTGRDQAVMA